MFKFRPPTKIINIKNVILSANLSIVIEIIIKDLNYMI